MAALDDKAKAIIDKPNLAFVATVMADGSPQVTPVWIERLDDTITFNTATGRVKERNMRRDPRIALSVVDREDDYARSPSAAASSRSSRARRPTGRSTGSRRSTRATTNTRDTDRTSRASRS